MSMEERTGERDLLYSKWHRPSRIKEWMTPREAAMLTQIDIDWCEYCAFCGQPVALIETQESHRGPKSARVTSNLADLATMPAYSVAYQRTESGDDIALFTVRQLRPIELDVGEMLPNVYAYWLLSLRKAHNRASPECGRKAA